MNRKFNAIIVEDDPLTCNIIETFSRQSDLLDLIGVFHDPVAALPVLTTGSVEIAYLDVEMPGMNAFELISSLKTRPQVIIISGKKEYALNAFEFEAVDFLAKPVGFPRFLRATQKAIAALNSEKRDSVPDISRLLVKDKGVFVPVRFDDIWCLESNGDYTFIHTLRKKYIVLESLKSFSQRLPAHKFIRVHKSWMINIDEVDKIDGNTICIREKMIPVGSMYKENLMKFFQPPS